MSNVLGFFHRVLRSKRNKMQLVSQPAEGSDANAQVLEEVQVNGIKREENDDSYGTNNGTTPRTYGNRNRKRAASLQNEPAQKKRIKTENENHTNGNGILDNGDTEMESEELSICETVTESRSSTPSTGSILTPSSSPTESLIKRRSTRIEGFPVTRITRRNSSTNASSEVTTPQSSLLGESVVNSEAELGNDGSVSDSCDSSTYSSCLTETDVSEETTSEEIQSETNMIEADMEVEKLSTSSNEPKKKFTFKPKPKPKDEYFPKVLKGELIIPGVNPSLLTYGPPYLVPEKTNYLKVGMLSSIFKRKEDGMKQEFERIEKPYIVDADGFPKISRILPPPDYADYTIRHVQGRYKDFFLPYDIWCTGVINTRNCYEKWKEEEEARLEAMKREMRKSRRKSQSQTKVLDKTPKEKTMVPSWKFKKIRQNQYLRKPTVNREVITCSCEEGPSKCASEDCLNRVIYTECRPECGDQCKNRRFQKHEDSTASLTRFMTESKGFGVRAKEPIKRGDFILEYVGEVVPDAVFQQRMHTIYSLDTHHYCLQLENGLVIDGHRAGGECRFVNHSCQPNCEMQKWSVNGLARMGLFALRDIEVGEELSYDYNFSLYNPAEGQPCHCGSENCRGVIGNRKKSKIDSSADSRRQKDHLSRSKGLHGLLTWRNDPRSNQMKTLTNRERKAIRKHRIFLIRNYDKLRASKGMDIIETFLGDRMEKLMSSWVSRFKTGSCNNKPLVLNHDEDPAFAELAKTAQVLYELWAAVTHSKDETGHTICEAFMQLPQVSKSELQEIFGMHREPLDLTMISKKIMRGEYVSLNMLESDIGLVLKSFCHYLENTKPSVHATIDKIKAIYAQEKAKAIAALEPFILNTGDLNMFKPCDSEDSENITRCICGIYEDEGTMVQCEKCKVWQHLVCMRPNMDQIKRLNQDQIKSIFKSSGVDSEVKSTGTASTEALRAGSLIKPEVKEEIMEEYNGFPQPKIEISTDYSEMETQRIDIESYPVVSIDGIEDNGLDALEECKPDCSGEDNIRMLEDTLSGTEPYFCERCFPRPVDLDIPVAAPTEDGKTMYKTLVREDGFVVRANDTVYVLRKPAEDEKSQDGDDIGGNDSFVSVGGTSDVMPSFGRGGAQSGERSEVTYKTAGLVDIKNCDIFRIQCVWITAGGERQVFGHHYLRPDETFHERSRKFYPNEIVKSPITEIIDIDAIYGPCWVLDSATYALGRPIGAEDEHVYICDFRVDKKARIFAKLGKNNPKTCTNCYAFRFFKNKLKIQRNVHPHGPPSPNFKAATQLSILPDKSKTKKQEGNGRRRTLDFGVKERKSKADKVNRILSNLHSRVQNFTVSPVDASYLLGRSRKSKSLSAGKV